MKERSLLRREFAALIGAEATRRLVEAFGGTRLYIPMACRLRPSHKLVLAVGWEAALALCREYGGISDLKIPTCREPVRLDVMAIVSLRSQATPVSRIALTIHCTEKAVYGHLKRLRMGESLGKKDFQGGY